MNPYAILVALALLAGSYGGGRWQQWRSDDKAQAAAILKSTQDARTKESNWQSDAATADEVHDEELSRIHAQHLRDLERLRNRTAERLPATPASCAGASPAALSAKDSAVAVGWGAEFDSLRSEYSKCKSAVERIRGS